MIFGVSYFVARSVGLPLGIATYLAGIFLYFPLMESSRSQATIGKGICALAVTDPHGQRISIPRAYGRCLVHLVTRLMGIGYLLIFVTQRKQTLHDLVAGTLVLRRGLY